MAFSVSYTYKIIDRYSGALAKIRKATDKFQRSAKRAQQATKNFSNKMLSAQNAFMSIGGVIGGWGVLGQVLAFETAMNKLASVALTTKKNISIFREKAKELGRTTKFTATQVALGMVQLKLAGMKVGQIKKAIGPTLDLAAAGGLEISQAAIIATDALGAMQLKIKGLPKVMDILGLAQSKAKFDITQLAEGMKTSAATARFLGFDLSTLTALLGTMAKSGLRGSSAGTLLRNALTRISGASRKTLRRFRKLGINLDDFRTKLGKIKNFDKFIEKLRQAEKQGKLTAGRMQDLFGIRGFRAIQSLMVEGGMKFFKKIEADLRKSGGTIKKMVKEQMKGLPGAFLEFKSAIEAVNVALFGKDGLGGFLERVLDKMTKFLRKLSEASPKTLKFAAAIGTIAVIGAPTLMFLGLLSSSISSVFGALATLTSGFIFIAGLLPKIIGFFIKTTASTKALVPYVGMVATKVGFLSKVFGFLVSPAVLITGAIALFTGGLIYLAVKSQKVSDALKRLWNAIKVIFGPFKVLFKLIEPTVTLFKPLIDSLIETAKAFDFVEFAASGVAKIIDGLTGLVEILLKPFEALTYLMEKAAKFQGVVVKGITGEKGLYDEIGEYFFGGPKKSPSNVASDYAKKTTNTLNGRIGIDITGPGKVTSSEIEKSFGGNLGFNMGN